MSTLVTIAIYAAGFLGAIVVCLIGLTAGAFFLAHRHYQRKGFQPTHPLPPSRWRGHQRRHAPPHLGIW